MKNKNKLKNTILALASSTPFLALASSCQHNNDNEKPKPSPNPVTPKITKEQINENLNDKVKNIKLELVSQNLKKDFASKINYTNITSNYQNKDNYIFQYYYFNPDDEHGTLKVDFYLKYYYEDEKRWITSAILNQTFEGFRTYQNEIDDNVSKIKLEFKDKDNKVELPSSIILKNTFIYSNYDVNKYKIISNPAANDNEGKIELSYRLKDKKSNLLSKEMKASFSGFKTTLMKNRDDEKRDIDNALNLINALETKNTIDKNNTQASSIKNEDILISTQSANFNFNILELSPDNEHGNLFVKFQLQSKKIADIKSEEKTLKIPNFLTDQEILNRKRSAIINRLNSELANIKFKLDSSINKNETLPSEITQKDKVLLASTLVANENYKIIELKPNDKEGKLIVVFKLIDNSEPKLGEVESTQAGEFIIDTLMTTELRNRKIEKQNLKSAIDSLDDIKVNKNKIDFLPSQIKEADFELDYQNFKIIIIDNSITKNDKNGTISLKVKLHSQKFDDLYSEEKTLTLKGFLTTDQHINNVKKSETAKLNQIIANVLASLKDENKKKSLASFVQDNDIQTANVPIDVKCSIKLEPNNDKGKLKIVLSLIKHIDPENIDVQSENKEITINGFQNQKDYDIAAEKVKLNNSLSNINNFELLNNEDKKTVLASWIEKGTKQLKLDITYGKISDISYKANDTDGSLEVKFKVQSSSSVEYLKDLKTDFKTITIFNFMTSAEYKAKETKITKDELTAAYDKNKIKWNYSTGNALVTLPSETKDSDFILENKLDQEIKIKVKEIKKLNGSGIVQFIYQIAKNNKNINEEITLDSTYTYEIQFQTSLQRAKSQEQARINNLLAKNAIEIKSDFDIKTHLASELSINNLEYLLDKDNNVKTTTRIEKVDDEHGKITIIYVLTSNKYTDIKTAEKPITFEGFMTAEQKRINELKNKLEFTASTTLDESIYDFGSFVAFYKLTKESKNKYIPTSNDLSSLYSVKTLTNAKLIIDSLDTSNFSFFYKPYSGKITFNYTLISIKDNKTKTTGSIELDYTEIFTRRGIQRYFDKCTLELNDSKYIERSNTYSNELANKNLDEWFHYEYPQTTEWPIKPDSVSMKFVSADKDKGTAIIKLTTIYKGVEMYSNKNVDKFNTPANHAAVQKEIDEEIKRLDTIMSKYDLYEDLIFLTKYCGIELSKFSLDNEIYNLGDSNLNAKLTLKSNIVKNDPSHFVEFDYVLESSQAKFAGVTSSIQKHFKSDHFINEAKAKELNAIKENVKKIINDWRTKGTELPSKDPNKHKKYEDLLKDYFPKDPKLKPEQMIKTFHEKIEPEFNKFVDGFFEEAVNQMLQSSVASYGPTDNVNHICEMAYKDFIEILPDVLRTYASGLNGPKPNPFNFIKKYETYARRTMNENTFPPLIYDFFDALKDNKDTLNKDISSYIDTIKDNPIFNGINDKNSFINDLKTLCYQNWAEILRYHYEDIDWRWIFYIQGLSTGPNHGPNYDRFRKLFPDYKSGKIYLMTTGWDRIFDDSRHYKNLDDALSTFNAKYNLNDNQKAFAKKVATTALNPIYKIIENYQKNINKKLFNAGNPMPKWLDKNYV